MYTFRIVPILVLASTAAASAGSQSAPMPPLPVTQLDVRQKDPDLDGQRISVSFAGPTPIRDVLLLLVRDTPLSVVPDSSLEQSFVGDLKNVSVREALDLILEPLGLDYSVRGRVLRVFAREPETRLFYVDYVNAERLGNRTDATAGARAPNRYDDLAAGVGMLLSPNGRMSLDRTAALLQVTDTPSRLARVEQYLEVAMLRATRQVQIEGKFIEVALRDEFAAGIDWRAVLNELASAGRASQTLAPVTAEGFALALKPGGYTALMNALAGQGTVTVLSSPLITAMNNEPAVMRTGTRELFLGATTLTEGVTLSVTPQISAEGIVHLSLTPSVTKRTGVAAASRPGEPPPAVTVREADTLVRVRQGETIVIAGWMLNHASTDTERPSPRRTDLVILLTPTVTEPGKAR